MHPMPLLLCSKPSGSCSTRNKLQTPSTPHERCLPWHLSSPTSHHCSAATPAFLFFLQQTRFTPTTGPLHVPLLRPEIPPLAFFTWFPPPRVANHLPPRGSPPSHLGKRNLPIFCSRGHLPLRCGILAGLQFSLEFLPMRGLVYTSRLRGPRGQALCLL